MSAPTLDKILAMLRDLGAQGAAGVDVYAPITPQALGWLQEKFRAKLERELPAELVTLLQLTDGCQLNTVAVLGSRGAHGLFDHNLEMRTPPGKWLAGHIIFATKNQEACYVIDVDTKKFHVADYMAPRFVKTFATFPELMKTILVAELGLKVRNL